MNSETSNNVIWEKGVSKLAGELDPQIFSAYIKPLKFSSFDHENTEFEVLAPSMFIRNQVDRNFREKLIRALTTELSSSSASFKPSSAGVNVKLLVAPASSENKGLTGQHVVVKKIRPQGSPVGSQAMYSAGNDFSGYQRTDYSNGPATLQQSANAAFSLNTQPSLNTGSSLNTGQRAYSPYATPQHKESLFFSHGLNPRYTFSSFVVGNSNQFCHAAAQRVAENPGRAYNPLFIYGGVGLGKTHILHAIGNALLASNPSARVVYMSSETFTNQLIQALRNSRMEEFKNKMRSVHLLLIDDIQFMCGKERTQEEFFHTFNSLYSSKCQIVITSDKLPQDIPGIEERLQTRFSWGLTADIQSPDFETRVAILRRKASAESFELPNNVAEYIAERVSSNVRELEGAFTRLHAVSSLQGRAITMELAESALKPLLQPKAINLTIDDIKKAVSEQFNIKVSEIVSKRRTKNLSFPRHIAMYLCRKHTTCSYPEIGENFGGRDHSSVIHASHVVSSKVSSDPQVKDLILQIEKRLLST